MRFENIPGGSSLILLSFKTLQKKVNVRQLNENYGMFFPGLYRLTTFSSPEPLGLICDRPRPRDQETTGSGDENEANNN